MVPAAKAGLVIGALAGAVLAFLHTSLRPRVFRARVADDTRPSQDSQSKATAQTGPAPPAPRGQASGVASR